ncbi:MAG TPA: hypothetical protein VMZ28_07660 [Kofleriaceae bacterium]|nr:hypothetical protein [Kofleriaceae bacterium]
MTPRRYETEPRDAVTTTPESPPLHRPRPSTPPPPPPSARRARVAAGSAPPSAINLRRPPQEDGLDAVVAGLLGRAKRQTRHPQLPDAEALDVRPEGTAQNETRIPPPVPAPSVRPTRWPWIALAFAAGAGIATAIALALAS